MYQVEGVVSDYWSQAIPPCMLMIFIKGVAVLTLSVTSKALLGTYKETPCLRLPANVTCRRVRTQVVVSM